MNKVNQEETCAETGDCMRASIASVLEIDLQAVPHLTRTPKLKWFSVMYYFFIAYEYKYSGMWYPTQSKRQLKKSDSINGFFLASVNSRNHEGVTHLVVMDSYWRVAHDPHPSKSWQDEMLFKNKDFVSVYKFRKMNKTDKGYWYYL
jgi:hypothetical protein